VLVNEFLNIGRHLQLCNGVMWQTTALVHGHFGVTDKLDLQALNVLLQVANVHLTTIIDCFSVFVQEVLIVPVCLLQREIGLVGEDVSDSDQLLASVSINALARAALRANSWTNSDAFRGSWDLVNSDRARSVEARFSSAAS
jgi:hypothetical protein